MPSDPLSITFSALADPTRRAILARLALGETSVTELAEPFSMSLPAISKHLKVLEHAGLIARGREAQWRPCRITPIALKDVDGWLDKYRRFWDESFDRLDDYLQELQAQEKLEEESKDKRKPKSPNKARESKHGRKSK
jgi:DNA-binding transcriptional ArsR family regulator